ncbi:polysaccharide deacetylase family protein [Aquimarina aquimarini]|uniref:polysaccharide deacetylase family protein n=1 Tax=Aquimarina aquimarini TaxID=1191734 RepID=UPI000D55CAAE|nr:polysaccharide deacetylase family protein [Aquimarina aquimarini]
MKRNMYISLLMLVLVLSIACDIGDDTIVLEQIKDVTIEVSKWKNDSKGVYSLIHDDFGIPNANGIANYADSIATDHDIKFGFAIITSEVDQTEWGIANKLIDNGHEPINHTHNHYCGLDVSWCPTKIWGVDDFDVEIDVSHQLIFDNTGVTPLFFAFPFDLYTTEMLTYLAAKKYLGARSGAYTQGVSSDFLNDTNTPYFGLKFYAHGPNTPIENLNKVANMAVQEGLWAIREVHGVADGSWGTISIPDYTNHIEVLQELQNQGELWVSPPSEVIKYIETSKHTRFDIYQEDTALYLSVIYDKSTNTNSEITFTITYPKEIEIDKITTVTEEEVSFLEKKSNKVFVNINPEEINKLKIRFKKS